jgi:hypothetical protein
MIEAGDRAADNSGIPYTNRTVGGSKDALRVIESGTYRNVFQDQNTYVVVCFDRVPRIQVCVCSHNFRM